MTEITPRIAAWCFDALKPVLELVPFQIPAHLTMLDEVSACLPFGAYTTLRTYEGEKALRLDEHLQRLMNTAKLAGKPLPLQGVVMREALRQVVRLFWEDPLQPHLQLTGDLRIRLTVDLEQQPGTAYIIAQPLKALPSSAYIQGVAVITTHLERLLPEAKLTRFIERSRMVRLTLPEGVNEALMVNPSGELTEGLSSNFFGVLAGQVRTAGSGVLAGVTRALVLENIHQQGHPMVFKPLRLDDLPHLDEAFLTSSSRGLLPICRIDQSQVGAGVPGEITLALMEAFSSSIRLLVEPI
jgi:branched-chain amino acid aminotransferase